jgi:hypothetical protein
MAETETETPTPVDQQIRQEAVKLYTIQWKQDQRDDVLSIFDLLLNRAPRPWLTKAHTYASFKRAMRQFNDLEMDGKIKHKYLHKVLPRTRGEYSTRQWVEYNDVKCLMLYYCVNEFIQHGQYDYNTGVYIILCYDTMFNDSTNMCEHLDGELQPTRFQTHLMERFSQRLGRPPTPYEWINHLTAHNVLFCRWGTLPDLLERCVALIMELVNANKRTIITMDGHGRTVYMLIALIQYVRMTYGVLTEPVRIVICEIDDTVQRWHEQFFPIHQEPLDGIQIIAQKINILTSITPDDLVNSVIYYNFCSLGDQISTMYECMRRLQQLKAPPSYFFFSSARIHGAPALTKLLKMMANPEAPVVYDPTPITKRRDFITYRLPYGQGSRKEDFSFLANDIPINRELGTCFTEEEKADAVLVREMQAQEREKESRRRSKRVPK